MNTPGRDEGQVGVVQVKAPAQRLRRRSNHFFASIYAFLKLERLKMKHQVNHFALRAKLVARRFPAGPPGLRSSPWPRHVAMPEVPLQAFHLLLDFRL